MPMYPAGTRNGDAFPASITLKCGNTTAATTGYLYFVNTSGRAERLTSATHGGPVYLAASAALTAATFQAYQVTSELLLRTTAAQATLPYGCPIPIDFTNCQVNDTAVTTITTSIHGIILRALDGADALAGKTYDTTTLTTGTQGTPILIYLMTPVGI